MFILAFANCASRKKRAVSNVIVVPDEGDDTIYEYDPPDREFVLPTWPTKSGKTFFEVEQFCNESIFNSTTGKVCSVTLRSDFDVAAFRNECISDIQVTSSIFFNFEYYSCLFICCFFGDLNVPC